MKGFGLLVAGFLAWAALAAPVAQARGRCCLVPAGTVVQVALVDEISTKKDRAGDSFAFRLAQPIVVNGMMVARAGTPGAGVIIEASKPGMGGKPAKLVLAARYLSVRGRDIALQGLQLSGAGKSNAMAAQAVGLSGIAFAPLGFVGLAVQGGDVTFAPGTTATAKLSDAVTLPSLGRASREAIAAAAAAQAPIDAASGAIDIPPPPAGQGQIVFFRPKSLMGTGQWFNVRENGEALGRLTNGAYFIEVTAPGLHTYTASEEPEFKDKLKLEIDAGETYFVEGGLSKGLVLSAANLSPSNRQNFDKASGDLKLASADASAAPSGQSSGPADQSAAAAAAPSDATPAASAPPTGAADSDLGYGWAKQNKVTDVASCPAAPSPYRAGCLNYVGALAAASSSR